MHHLRVMRCGGAAPDRWAQLTEAEVELATARRALDARDVALAEARRSLRELAAAGVERTGALTASLAEALAQVNALTEQVSEHLARERAALRGRAEAEAALAALRSGGGLERSEEEVQAGVRVVVPEGEVGEAALLAEQLAERDGAILELRGRLAEAVQGLTHALGRAIQLLNANGGRVEGEAGIAAGAATLPYIYGTAAAAGAPATPAARPRRASASEASPAAAGQRLGDGGGSLPPRPPAATRLSYGTDQPDSVAGSSNDGRSPRESNNGAAAALREFAGAATAANFGGGGGGGGGTGMPYRTGSGMPMTPPGSPSTSPMQLSRSTSVAAAAPPPPAGPAATGSRSQDAPTAAPADVSGAAGGGPRRQDFYQMVYSAATAAAASTGPGNYGGGVGGVEAAEAEASRAAASAAASGLLSPAGAEGLRLRLLLQSASREVWALRNRLAAADAEAEAQREAQLEAVGGALDATGCLVSRLRAQLSGMRLRHAGPPLMARVQLAQRSLAAEEAEAKADAAAAEADAEAEPEAVAPPALALAEAAAARGDGESAAAEPRGGLAAPAALAAARRLLGEAAAHIAGLCAQAEAEAGLRAQAEEELAELRGLFEAYVQRTVAQVQGGLAVAGGGGA
ncbi:hypothetical protein GPECTOR_56g340 [Gonium pectorale]|uniref:Uncharacterized protein n=1 Tax=Gonium pectorale TaxID=33097 RepID=A0A150G5Z6_GONPE|nr:hypothetical protein GPECTOR_56g340 [Gonium pectorale]|eukprot:KXZ45244.1 hypothetical protein GPECTOR_56g340 [Gonium pectorale]